MDISHIPTVCVQRALMYVLEMICVIILYNQGPPLRRTSMSQSPSWQDRLLLPPCCLWRQAESLLLLPLHCAATCISQALSRPLHWLHGSRVWAVPVRGASGCWIGVGVPPQNRESALVGYIQQDCRSSYCYFQCRNTLQLYLDTETVRRCRWKGLA